MVIALIILLIIIIAWYNWDYIYAAIYYKPEHYLPCTSCDESKLPSGGLTVINPFIWPYSAAACTDGMYMQKELDKLASSSIPLTSMNTPDHVAQTN